MIRRILLSCAAIAVLVPAIAGEAPLHAQAAGRTSDVNVSAQPERQSPALGLDGIATAPLRILEGARHPAELGQMRIRQRVIIRVSPSPPEVRARLQALQASRSESRAVREVAHDGCVRVENIIGVQPTTDNRLLLFMENRNVLAATLDRSCTAQAFYSGFYVERAGDGQLCVRRDLLQSRAGASCAVEQMTRLVAAGD